MEHILSLISDYAGDIDDLNGIISHRTYRVRQLEKDITRLERYLEEAKELYNEGYQGHEIDLLMGCSRF